MKQKIRFLWKGIFFLLLFFAGTTRAGMKEVKAAGMYEDAKVFFENTGKGGKDYHATCYNGNIYYATQAKLASSSTNLKYGTVGYDVTVRGEDGTEISFSVKRVEDGSGVSGSMAEVPGSRVYANGYEYNLYSISSDRLYDIMDAKDATKAQVLRNSSIVKVRIDAIMTTKKNGTLHGDVTENSAGTLTEWHSENLYHLKNESEWNALKKIFSGHYFNSFRNINEDIKNHTLMINYDLDGGIPKAGNCTVENDLLYSNGSMHITSMKILQKGFLVSTGNLWYPGREIAANLQKPGYHIEEGKEWISKYNGAVYGDENLYSPKELYPPIADGSHGITMIANWQPNIYYVKYDTDGGNGVFPTQQFVYNEAGTLHRASERGGYRFIGWQCDACEKCKNGGYHAAEEVVGPEEKHLTTIDKVTVTMTALWEEEVYTIKTDKKNPITGTTGSGGTDAFYEKYSVGWYSIYANDKVSGKITKISVPTMPGYVFAGYFTGRMGYGTQIVAGVPADGESAATTDGMILVAPDFFEEDATVYSHWRPATYTITYDKQGGTGGLNGTTSNDTAKATYNAELPEVPPPTRKGYSFKGYFTGKNGTGTKYYDEKMNGQLLYTEKKSITLYAYWVDETPPTVKMWSMPTSEWTRGLDNATLKKRCVNVKFEAEDDGDGLASVTLYKGDAVDKNKVVTTYANLGGVTEYANVYAHSIEGTQEYTIQAVDKAGNTAVARTVVRLDVTPPKGTVKKETFDSENMTLKIDELFVTDYIVK